MAIPLHSRLADRRSRVTDALVPGRTPVSRAGTPLHESSRIAWHSEYSSTFRSENSRINPEIVTDYHRTIKRDRMYCQVAYSSHGGGTMTAVGAGTAEH